MSAEDIVVFVILFFIIATISLTGYYALNTSINQMLTVPQINSSAKTVAALQGGQAATNKFDYLVFGFFIGSALSIIILGWLIGGHPIFMFIYFFVVVIATILSTIISNIWETISTTSAFLTSAAHFPITNFLMLKLPMFITIVGLIGLAVMFAKPYMSEGGQL